MRCPRCKHRPIPFRATILYPNPFRCQRCDAVLSQGRLLLLGLLPVLLFAALHALDGLMTGDLAATAAGLTLAVSAWLGESAASHHLLPYRLCDPGLQPQVPPARLVAPK